MVRVHTHARMRARVCVRVRIYILVRHGPRGAVVVDRAAIRFNDDVFAVDAAVWRAVASRDALRAMDTHACECRRLRRLFKKVAITKRGVSSSFNINECARFH